MEIELPVSIGEALDKLTILEIKMKYISDNRKKDVQKEFDRIYPQLSPHIEKCKNLYKILKQINEEIWILQDEIRSIKFKKENMGDYCIKILDENDRRFRVKNKINTMFNSSLKEQKGYNPTKCILIPSNDRKLTIGLVMYLTTYYDIVEILSDEIFTEFSDEKAVEYVNFCDSNKKIYNEKSFDKDLIQSYC